MNQTIEQDSSPSLFNNWRWLERGAHCAWTIEAGVFTDAKLFGDYDVGPLKFINTVAPTGMDTRAQEAVVVRLSWHCPPPQHRPTDKTDDANYHGGDYLDEVAALFALLLGIRAEAGPISRIFDATDPLGTPRTFDNRAEPALGPYNLQSRILPGGRTANLADLSPLAKFPRISRDFAIAVVKTARLYQQAIWVVESQPELAWIFLVSAVEAAAQKYHSANTNREETMLPADIEAALAARPCAPELQTALREFFFKKDRATKKFISFLVDFVPSPPAERPVVGLQLDYSKDNLRKAFRTIYAYRSRALHDGVPFPHPMCTSPMMPTEISKVPEEVFSAHGEQYRGAKWAAKDIPMLLHTFEYLSRHALLNWLNSIPEEEASDISVPSSSSACSAHISSSEQRSL